MFEWFKNSPQPSEKNSPSPDKELSNRLEPAQNPVLNPIYSSFSQMVRESEFSTQQYNNAGFLLMGTSGVCGYFGLAVGSLVGGVVNGNFLSAFIWGLASLGGGAALGVFIVMSYAGTHECCLRPLAACAEAYKEEQEREEELGIGNKI